MSPAFEPVFIRRLALKNFLSFGPESPDIELGALNVLIGPNGSGKSNLVEAIHFMRSAPAGWVEATKRGGGVAQWIWKGNPLDPSRISLTYLAEKNKELITHEVTFIAVGAQFDLVQESLREGPSAEKHQAGYYSVKFPAGVPTVARLDTGGLTEWEIELYESERSILAQLRDPIHHPIITRLSRSYEQVRIYREWTFGRNSTFRQPQPADMRRDYLAEDFSNLGLFLNRIRTEHPVAKRALITALQELYEGISDFDVSTNSGTVQLFLHEGDFAIPATRLSDGTLRYLCLLAILCDPSPPPLICLEEPELGLHPDILPGLARLLKQASERTQLIVTTHSEVLVDAMTDTPEAVIVCEKVEGQTRMERLSQDKLKGWLERYRLGELWTRGHIGGNRW